jgi:hypothetical protein
MSIQKEFLFGTTQPSIVVKQSENGVNVVKFKIPLANFGKKNDGHKTFNNAIKRLNKK